MSRLLQPRSCVQLSCVVLLMSLAACAPKSMPVASDTPISNMPASSTPAPDQANVAPMPAPATPAGATPACDASGAQSFVGQSATDANIAAARSAAHAGGTVRVVKPGQPVTMDYREDRLNIEIDDQRMIVKLSCG